MRIILASQSPTRRALLENAGLVFEATAAAVDERAIDAAMARAGAGPERIALALAEAKAAVVSARHPEALVIGADQVLDAGGERWHKPASRGEARTQLLALSGRSHHLRSAVVGMIGGAVRWRHVESACLTMRVLGEDEVERYLDRVGAEALASVGAYQIEGPGIQLFEHVAGDHFAILGLPLLPVISWLRTEGVASFQASGDRAE